MSRCINNMLVLSQLIAFFLLSGCENDYLSNDKPQLFEQSRGTKLENEATSKEEKVPAEVERPKQDSLPSLCKEFEVSLFERPIRMEHKGLELTSTSSLTLKSPQLTPEASIEERCDEIEKNFSGALSMYNGGMIRRMTLFVFKFEPTVTQENQIKNGESVYVNPSKVQIDFTDGQYYHLNRDIPINCERSFELKCEHPAVDAKECKSYIISYPDQVCTFQTKWITYVFSDQQRQAIDLNGEIRLSKQQGNLLVVKGIRW